jgi:type IV pilus assembly protein PilV
MISENKNGFTLIEVLMAMVVLSIGILAISMMQIKAIEGNSEAYSRSVANNVGTTVIEELKRLPFDDSNLSAGFNLDAGKASAGGSPDPSAAGHELSAGLLPALSNVLTVSGNQVIDDNNKSYTVFWNVINNNIFTGSGTKTPYCTIKLFVYWDTPLGTSHLEFTAVKDNNFLN